MAHYDYDEQLLQVYSSSDMVKITLLFMIKES